MKKHTETQTMNALISWRRVSPNPAVQTTKDTKHTKGGGNEPESTFLQRVSRRISATRSSFVWFVLFVVPIPFSRIKGRFSRLSTARRAGAALECARLDGALDSAARSSEAKTKAVSSHRSPKRRESIHGFGLKATGWFCFLHNQSSIAN